ncbi:MAG: transglycosylase SLT domain-containing protein [Gallionellaceae bacterium]
MKFLLLTLLLIPALAAAGPDAPGVSGVQASATASAADEDFLAAREAFRVGDAAQFERSAAHLGASPLEPYVAYYRLRMHLETEDADAIRAFLARPDDTPVIDRLRGEWLKWLGKNQKWDDFDAEYPRLLNKDAELSCYELQSRLRTQKAEVMEETRQLWLTDSSELPVSCTTLFDLAIDAGAISEQDVWQRVRFALDANNVPLAKTLVSRLSARRRLSAKSLNYAATNPRGYLNAANLKKSNETRHALALFALQRLAGQLPQLAFNQWQKLSPYFDTAEHGRFYAMLGYEAAKHLDSRALEWFKDAGASLLTAKQLAWRTRVALREQDWNEVLASIEDMALLQQQEDTWYYWKARALKALGRTSEATQLFSTLSGKPNFYGQLAAEELGVAPTTGIMLVSYLPSEEELSAMLARPAMQRTLALSRMNLRTEAYREWIWAVRNFDDWQLLTAAEIARRNGMYDRAINTAERTVQLHDFNLRYLAPYRDTLQTYIRQNDLDEAWVYGLMRQESRFVTVAKSDAGARGLMQIMPATARWVARRLGMRDYRNSSIHQMETNFTLGTYYMKSMLSRFNNSPVLATAAYNAGPTRARQWCGEIPMEGAIYIETIPFDETREYVKKVMSNTEYYAELFGKPARSLKERLGMVVARDTANQLPGPEER